MKSEKIIAGILLGAAAGAILGVLFAPDKGKKTRRKIVDGSLDFKDSLKDKMNDFVDSITEQFNHAKAEAMKKSKDGLEDVRGKVKHSMS